MQRVAAIAVVVLAFATFAAIDAKSKKGHNPEEPQTDKKCALIAVANGTDEIEAVITASVLRRAGINVVIGGLGCEWVTTSHQIGLKADEQLKEEIGEYDAIVIPGGQEGAKRFADNPATGKALKKQEDAGKLIAAICAGPLVLKSHNIGEGKKLTAHSKVAEEVKQGKYTFVEERVVVDGNLITAQSPGATFEFALAIVEKLLGEEKKKEVCTLLELKQ